MKNAWKLMKLSEVLQPVSRPETVDPMKEYRLLGIRLHGAGPFHRESKLGSQVSAKTFFQVRTGDFIYSRLFAWRGAFGVIASDLDGSYVSSEFPTFTANPGKINLEFLRLWFHLPSTISSVEADCTGSTPLTRNRFKEQFFCALEIPLPPLSDQRRIVARIEGLAAKIEEARRLRKAAEVYTHKVLLGAYKQITEGARWTRMAEIAPLVRRPVQINPSTKYYEIGIRSFGRGTFHKPPIDGASLGTKKIFHIEANDLLFNIVFAWEAAVAVAKPQDHGRVGSHRFLTCVPKDGLATPVFLCFHFLTDEGLEQLGKASPGGAGRNRTLGLKALEEIAVPLPAFHKQQWFCSLMAKGEFLKRLQAETAAELDAMLPSILDKAFKGEL